MRLFFHILPCLLVVACATGKKSDDSADIGKTMSQRFNGKSIKQDANGNWPSGVANSKLPESDRKSGYFTGDSNLPKAYQAGEYKKSSWWGGKTYKPGAYAGNTDGSRFQTASRAQGQGARESGVAAGGVGIHQTGAYETGASREGGAKPVDKPTDAVTANRRETYPEPVVSGWKEQRRMDLKTTNRILGRN
ncbi:MAG: hypothetical protein K9N23_20515 [Akkermansiaceae bacterium]|nr:hypothetical protein [Akkermansiaceae bacterium]